MPEQPKEPTKVFAVMIIARQINGEYVLVRSEKGFRTMAKAEEYLRKLKPTLVTLEGKPKPMVISTPNGDVICFCEAGPFEIEIED